MRTKEEIEELERAYSRLVVGYQRTQSERDSALRELEQLKKDKADLDWLSDHPLKAEVKGGSDDGHTGTFWGIGAASGTLREAIAAMRKENK